MLNAAAPKNDRRFWCSCMQTAGRAEKEQRGDYNGS